MSDTSPTATAATPPPAPPQSPMAPQSPLAQAATNYVGQIQGLTADEQSEFAAEQKDVAPYRQKVLSMLQSPNAAQAHLEKVQDQPKPEDYQKYSMEFASAMALIGALAGRFTRAGGTAALNAFSGALKGWHQGNLEAYNNAAKEWEQATKKTLENNQIEMEKYKQIMADKKANIDQMMAAMNIVAAEHQNKLMFDATLAKNYTMAFGAVDKMAATQDKLQGSFDKLMGFRSDNQKSVKEAVDLYNKRPDLFTVKQYLALKGAADTFGFKMTEITPETQFAGKGGSQQVDLSNPDQPPPGVKPRDWAIWADYERYTGKQPNLGWGAQMNAFKAKLSLYGNERQAQGLPIDPAAKQMAEQQAGYQGTLSGARSIGTRGANITMATNLASYAIPQALQASEAFPRGRWTPVNAAKLKLAEAGSDVALSKWDIANLQIAEMYARALNPTGQTIRKDMFDRAVSVISEAKSPEAYRATLESIYQAMQREHQGIGLTRQQQSGENVEAPDPFAKSGVAPEPGTVEEGYRFKGGDPADQNNWEKVH